MNLHQYLDHVGASVTGWSLAALLMASRTRLWARRAHKLARKSDIALPSWLTSRVARFVRDQGLLGSLLGGLLASLLWPLYSYDPRIGPHLWAQSYPRVVTGLPMFTLGLCLLLAMWPRWSASGARRVAHLGQVSVGQAFTPAEVTIAVIGAASSVATCLWGMVLVRAPVGWWIAFMAGYGAALAAWWWAVNTIMDRPSSATDEIELGWDDLLRFQTVRSVTVTAAWVPPLSIFFINEMAAQSGNTQSVPFWPTYVVIIVAVIVYLVFRQGRQLWRRAWAQPLPTP